MQIIKGVMITLNVLAILAMGYSYASVDTKDSKIISAIIASIFIANTIMII